MAKQRRGESFSVKLIILLTFGIAIVSGFLAIVKKFIDTLTPEVITTVTFVVVILFAAMAISVITAIPFFLIKQQKIDSAYNRRINQSLQSNRPQIIVYDGRHKEEAGPAPITSPDRLLPPKYTEKDWKIVDNEYLDLQVFGSEDNEW